MLERRKPLDLLFPLKGGASKEVGVRKEGMTAAQRLRAAVNVKSRARRRPLARRFKCSNAQPCNLDKSEIFVDTALLRRRP